MTMQALSNQVRRVVDPEPSFCDKHFAKIAFAVSVFVLAALTPLAFLFGAIVGLALQFRSKPTVAPLEPIVTVPNTLFTMVGACAALVQMTPGGAAGGLLFQAIPFAGSLAVGDTAYRLHRVS